MYILPTEPIRNRVVGSRIDPIVQYTKLYRENVGAAKKDIDSTSLKSIFKGKWNYVGSNSANTFFEFDADVLIYDEYDQCDQANLLIAKQRTGAAEREIWLKIGNPTIPGFGIDAAYEDSTKSVWMLKCPHCNKHQVLDWWKNFIDRQDNGQYFLRSITSLLTGIDASALCQFCFKPMDRLMPGEWIETHKDHPIHGYHCSKLFGRPGNDTLPERPIIREMFEDWIKAQSNQTALEIFYNQQLGLPYSAEGSHISLNMLAACARDYQMPEVKEGTFIFGMDLGKVHHVHISKMVKGKDGKLIRRKQFIGTIPSWDEADRLWKLFKIRRGCIDAGGEIHAPREFCRTHSGCFMVQYNLGKENLRDGVNISYNERTVRVNRTESLDASYADYFNQMVELPKNYLTLDSGDFTSQMTAATRRFDEKSARYVWDEGGRPDHHQHADNYERIAASMVVRPEDAVMVV